MKRLKLLIFSFLSAFMWGFCFLDIKFANNFTVILGIVAPIIGVLWLKEYFFQNNIQRNIDKLSIIAFPFLYTLLFYIMSPLNIINLLINPFLIGLLLLYFILWHHPSTTKEDLIYYLVGISFYALTIYPYWDEYTIYDSYSTSIESFYSDEQSLKDINLYDYQFINGDYDTIYLKKNSNFTIIKTWNETCIPCIQSFRDLEEFFDSINQTANIIFLYESKLLTSKETYHKIFNYKHIKNRSNILIDYKQNLFEAMNMKGYPRFIIFDPEGMLVFEEIGYSPKHKQKLITNICELINCEN